MPLKNAKTGFKLKRRTLGSVVSLAVAVAVLSGGAGVASAAKVSTGGAGYAPTPKLGPGDRARLSSDGRTAIAPENAPIEVKKAIWAANEITNKPYRYGGGHAKIKDTGYDCSGTVSYSLIGAGLLASPMPSSGFFKWGLPGRGKWITIYTHSGHMYAIIAGLRWDTSGPGEKGPRWRKAKRRASGFKVRHPEGF